MIPKGSRLGACANSAHARASKLLLSLIFVLALANLTAAQQTLSDSTSFLVLIGEMQTDISPGGVNLNDCALILPNGRFHLERRVQKLPNSYATLKVFESGLDSIQLQQLDDILNNDSVKKLPPVVWPVTPMAGSKFRGFRARIARGLHVQSVGYLVRQKRTDQEPPDSASDDENKRREQAEASLRPLLQWFHGLEASKLEPSGKKSTLCSAESDQ